MEEYRIEIYPLPTPWAPDSWHSRPVGQQAKDYVERFSSCIEQGVRNELRIIL